MKLHWKSRFISRNHTNESRPKTKALIAARPSPVLRGTQRPVFARSEATKPKLRGAKRRSNLPTPRVFARSEATKQSRHPCTRLAEIASPFGLAKTPSVFARSVATKQSRDPGTRLAEIAAPFGLAKTRYWRARKDPIGPGEERSDEAISSTHASLRGAQRRSNLVTRVPGWPRLPRPPGSQRRGIGGLAKTRMLLPRCPCWLQ